MRKAMAVVAALLLVGCVSRPDPDPAVMRQGPPPWEAPRDAISYIREAGLPELALDEDGDPFIVAMEVAVDGTPVSLPPFIGVDRLRAVQAPAHTHDDTGDLWLEGEGNREVTLGQFFTLWGVRFDGDCLAAACGGVEVRADGVLVEEPVDLVLRGHERIQVRAESE
ncbi:MAG TPA: hypothetical protein PKE40_13990 [Arachnia sp.]|nr:hypothetical protein [Arachnia sp.]HMT87454.1 hypothetical protein [Arachnia sp.]